MAATDVPVIMDGAIPQSSAKEREIVPPSLWLSSPDVIGVVDTETAYVRVEVLAFTSGPPAATVKSSGASMAMTPAAPKAWELYNVFEANVPLKVGANAITVTAIDGDGWGTSLSFYMLRLITDRTQADVKKLEQLQNRPASTWTAAERDWFCTGVLRGSYCDDDVNRVGLAVENLMYDLKALGYDPAVSPKTDWTMSDAMTRSTGRQYLSSVEAIRDAQNIDWLKKMPIPEDIRWLNYEGANQIEAALVRANSILPYYTAWTSGELTSGEE